ncbi:hypothetical protein ACLOJK_034446, partial [Asimina triloba]
MMMSMLITDKNGLAKLLLIGDGGDVVGVAGRIWLKMMGLSDLVVMGLKKTLIGDKDDEVWPMRRKILLSTLADALLWLAGSGEEDCHRFIYWLKSTIGFFINDGFAS